MNGKDNLALVTGATGAIGSALVKRLVGNGYRVRALVRRDSARTFPEGVEIAKGDITDQDALLRATAGAQLVFHLAAKLQLESPSPKLRDEYHLINVEGTRRLVKTAKSAGVERFIFFSTINVYGPARPGQLIDDDSPVLPDSLYAETKAQAEAIVLENLPSVVLRLAAVYGPRMKGNYARLLNALRQSRLAVVGNGNNRRTVIYTDDVCSAAILAARHESVVGKAFNVTDGEVHTLRDIINAMSDALGRPRPKVRLPLQPVRFAAGVLEDGLRLLGKRSPVGRNTIEKFTEDVAVSGGKIQERLGFRPRYDLATGWRETVRSWEINSH